MNSRWVVLTDGARPVTVSVFVNNGLRSLITQSFDVTPMSAEERAQGDDCGAGDCFAGHIKSKEHFCFTYLSFCFFVR